MSGGHFTLDELRACVRGEAADLVDPVVEHCRDCEDCGTELAAMMALRYRPRPWPIRALRRGRTALANVASRAPRRGPAVPEGILPVWRPTLIALAALLVMAVGALILADGSSKLQGGDAGAQDAAYAVLATNDSIGRLFAEARFRGGTPVSATAPPSLQGVVELMVRRDFDRAIEVLMPRIEARPMDAEAAAYLGISLYLKGEQPALARSLLEAGARHPSTMVSRESTWFLANLLLREGDLTTARRLLETLSTSVDLPARRARELLERMDAIARSRLPE